ncbi:Alcohol dehydrogenase 2 [Eumeta japonica]|uniref:Alcohol dehydrogenase 2 n=1 Tax=Eumeta variegata TaxID=151549 RepID=A0A4C2A611_EUMVA|nr:Alcohol dehydrogenase 2 [Eumeta japonica]
MRKDKGGRGGTVINISSIAALKQTPVLPIHSAGKSAVLQFSNCIGMEPHYSRTGVRVIAVCFGATATTLLSRQKFGGLDEATDAELEKHFENFYHQRPESAVAGVLQAFKEGTSGSTWLAANDKAPEEVTGNVKKHTKSCPGVFYRMIKKLFLTQFSASAFDSDFDSNNDSGSSPGSHKPNLKFRLPLWNR